MLTCKEVSALVSQSLDRRLSWRERLGVRLHLFICDACTRFKWQMEFLRRATQRFARGRIEEVSLQLSDKARDRILRALKQD